MKQKIIKEIEIPEGVEVKIDGRVLTVKGSEGELSREFEMEGFRFEVKEGKIIIGYDKSTKREKKLINTTDAHIHNMINGVQNKFEYKLKICFNHFPITIDLKDNEAVIKNFLGEKIPRHAKIVNGAEVNVKGQGITITSLNKEVAGQTAANFEKATKVKNRDRRIFQDGIFITSKPGREI
ncbi:MAG: 50S ribosomal protein L6 [Candidatus Pacearchaeota archaeon]|jgi:large subunit ribosomal protein L6